MINKVIEEAINLGLSVEIIKQSSVKTEIEILNGKLDKYIIGDNTNYKVKGLIDGKMVSLNTEKLSVSVLDELSNIAKVCENVDTDLFAKTNVVGRKIKSKELSSTLIEQLKSYSTDVYNRELVTNFVLGLEYVYTSCEIVNTNGVRLFENNNNVSYGIELVAKKNDAIKSKYNNLCLNDFNIDGFKECVDKSYNELVMSFDSKSINYSGNIIIRNGALGSILGRLVNSFFAETINKKMSMFNDDYLNVIASDAFTLREEPSNLLYPGTSLFDTEGVKRVDKDIILNGKFVNKLYNNKEAIKDGVESTGNASGVRNCFVVPSSNSYDELVKSLDNGIIIDSFMGIHAGMNAVSGAMSLQADGFLVNNGSIVSAVHGIILNTTVKELFNNIKMVGNDLVFLNQSIGAVSILVENMNITGEGKDE